MLQPTAKEAAAHYLRLSENLAATENNVSRFLEPQFVCSFTAGGGAKFTESPARLGGFDPRT
jgi:hypothetical protein